MTTLKDKLSASVRQAKAAQTTATKPAAAKPKAARSTAPKPAARKATPARPAAPKAAPRKAAAPKAAVKAEQKIAPGGIPESHNQLFPQRIWPD